MQILIKVNKTVKILTDLTSSTNWQVIAIHGKTSELNNSMKSNYKYVNNQILQMNNSVLNKKLEGL